MNRHEKKRIAAIATDVFLQEAAIANPSMTRKERREAARLLRKRVLRESPAHLFEKHAMVKPQIIVPEIQVQADGVETGAQEKRSPSGRIILAS
jgi:hypothetical protein